MAQKTEITKTEIDKTKYLIEETQYRLTKLSIIRGLLWISSVISSVFLFYNAIGKIFGFSKEFSDVGNLLLLLAAIIGMHFYNYFQKQYLLSLNQLDKYKISLSELRRLNRKSKTA